MPRNDPFSAQLRRDAQRAEQRENSARLATSSTIVTSTGAGEYRVPDRLTFGCVFTNEPSVSHGFAINQDAGDDLLDGQFPRVSAGVYKWDIDQRGLYLGCWVFVAVDIPSGATTPIYVLDHTFLFAAVAIKDLPAYLLKGGRP